MNSIKDDIMKRLKAIAVNTAKLCLKLPYNIVNKTYIVRVLHQQITGQRAGENLKQILLIN